MNISDFEKALQSKCLKDWFLKNVDNLIQGKPPRENAITKAIVNCTGMGHIVSQRNQYDIYDTKTKDIGEAAHNGTFQPHTHGIEHIISDYYKRLYSGASSDFFGLLYLMDLENLDVNSKLPDKYKNEIKPLPRPCLLQCKILAESLLNKLPGKIRIHEPFHNLKSSTETTILNYDIYLVSFKFNEQSANEIFKQFNSYDFFKRVGYNYHK